MITKETTQILLPGGEWLESILTAFELIDMELKRVADSSRCYGYIFAGSKKPNIVFNIFRTRDIPRILQKADIPAGGFTGTDILPEADIPYTPAWIFSLVNVLMDPPPRLYLGSTPNIRKDIEEPTVEDASRGTVYTTYPITANKFFRERGLSPNIEYLAGKVERVWDSDSTATAIVDISQTMNTALANEIKLIETVMEPEVAFIEKPGISRIDKFRIDCLQGDIYKRSRRCL